MSQLVSTESGTFSGLVAVGMLLTFGISTGTVWITTGTVIGMTPICSAARNIIDTAWTSTAPSWSTASGRCREVNTLMLVIRIKAMAKRANIARLDAGPKGATVQFHRDKCPNPAGLVEFLTDHRSQAKITDNKIFVANDWKTDADRIKGAFAIARDLAAKAKAAA